MTADEMRQVVARLANQGWVRWWMHLVPGHFVLSVKNADGSPGACIEGDMLRYGFRRYESRVLGGECWIVKADRPGGNDV